MIIYDGTKKKFLKDMDEGIVPDLLATALHERMSIVPGRPEKRSWENSLRAMYQVMADAKIPPDAGVALEYNIPGTSKRIDFLITGYDGKDKDNAVVIELKQWEEVNLVPGKDGIVSTYLGKDTHHEVPHPSYQALSYVEYLEDYNASVQDEELLLHPCAYLHNYRKAERDPLFDSRFSPYLDAAPAFTQRDIARLRSFIEKYVERGDGSHAINIIDKGKYRPSKKIQDVLARILNGAEEFRMIDDQKVVYETILHLARMSHGDGRKRVLIVSGGPGTGKTVVAVDALARLTTESLNVRYVTKNSAPRNVYREKLSKAAGTGRRFDVLFENSGSFIDCGADMYDALIVDEAHRLNEKSGMMHNQGENQVKEIINASRFSVFFIDEHQRVTVNDIGTVDEIKKWAAFYHAEVDSRVLESQFRCNGSDGYLSWVDNALGIRRTANVTFEGIDYDFAVEETPQELLDWIKRKNTPEHPARIIAGYCWEWPKEKRSDSTYKDIRIGNFAMSWNLTASTPYALDPKSVDQAGCIHTTQGLEFDYVGIIIGPDMFFADGHVQTDFRKRAKTDQSIRGLKGKMKREPADAQKMGDEIVRNTYRTLLTRGMKGCHVFCCDTALAQHLRALHG